MVIYDLQDYWTLVSAHRRGDQDMLLALEGLSHGESRAATLIRDYLSLLEEAS